MGHAVTVVRRTAWLLAVGAAFAGCKSTTGGIWPTGVSGWDAGGDAADSASAHCDSSDDGSCSSGGNDGGASDSGADGDSSSPHRDSGARDSTVGDGKAPGDAGGLPFTAGQVLLLPVGLGSARVAAADIDGDGKVDLVALAGKYVPDGGKAEESSVYVFLGRGDGTFKGAKVTTFPAWGYGLAVADMNGDGKVDVVTNNADPNSSSEGVIILSGKGDGTFDPPTAPVAAGLCEGFAVGDMNGDGDPDLVVAIPGLPVVYLADGHGGFTKQTSAGAPPANIPVGLDSDLPTIGIADLTGDKRADVALLVGQDTGGYALLVYPGDGAGGLGSPATATTGAEPSELAVADFDGDGTNDLLVIDDSAQSVAGSVLPFVNDAGTLTAASSFGAAVSDLSVCDLNGDGRADFVWNSANGASVNAYIGQGHGAFVSEPLSFGGGGAVNVQQVLTADLNGDGKTDIVAVSGGDGDWSLQVSLRAE